MSFSAPPQLLTFDGILSDFDGTIVDSTDGKWHQPLCIDMEGLVEPLHPWYALLYTVCDY